MSERIELVIIDPQWDFCYPGDPSYDKNKLPGDPSYDKDKLPGALFVSGADKDMERLAAMIDRIGDQISQIDVTLDCHHKIDVAHAGMWRDSDGNHPIPFTTITSQDIRDGIWTPIYPAYRKRFITYTEILEASGRYPLCIWPDHCLIGTRGNTVLPVLSDALSGWIDKKRRNVNYVSKGSNIFTEHYSAIKAEVPDPDDPTTQIDSRPEGLINTLMLADIIGIAGEAGSHCLANTVRDIADGFGDDSHIKKLVLIEDATSPVKTFEQLQKDFITEMAARGMQISNTADFLVRSTSIA